MLHFMSILKPVDKAPVPGEQKPFFGPDWRLTRTERDAQYLDGKWPEEQRERDDEGMRFVSLLSPPFL
jgi:hypothetical protein